MNITQPHSVLEWIRRGLGSTGRRHFHDHRQHGHLQRHARHNRLPVSLTTTLTINNTIGTNVTGVTLTGNATVNGVLALTSSDLATGRLR